MEFSTASLPYHQVHQIHLTIELSHICLAICLSMYNISRRIGSISCDTGKSGGASCRNIGQFGAPSNAVVALLLLYGPEMSYILEMCMLILA